MTQTILYRANKESRVVTGEPQLALPIDVEDHGEIRVYRMTLAFLPPSKNVYDGYPNEWKSGIKRKWINAVVKECEELAMPKGVQKVGLSAKLIFATKNRRDASNYAGPLWNFVPDGLQRAGVLVDDSDGHVQFGPNLGVSFAYDTRTSVPKKRREKTVISIAMEVR